MASKEQEKRLVEVYSQGVDMRKKYGGTATEKPKFPDNETLKKYNALVAEYKQLEIVIGTQRAKELREPKHVAAYGFSNLSKKAGGIGLAAVLLLVIAGGAYFMLQNKTPQLKAATA